MMHYDGRKSIATVHMSDSDNLKFREKTLLNFKAFCFVKKSPIMFYFQQNNCRLWLHLKIWKFLFFIFEIHKPSATKKQCFYYLRTFIFDNALWQFIWMLRAVDIWSKVDVHYMVKLIISLRENKVEYIYHITFTTNCCEENIIKF